MNESPFQLSLLARDRKLFLELTPEEADAWVTRVFDHIRPQMNLIRAVILEDGDKNTPLNLEVVLMVASKHVREVAVDMANLLLTPQRQQALLPSLSAYCDQLLSQGRDLDAMFVQQGLIGILEHQPAGQNTLLVEVCLRSIYFQVGMISGDPRKGFWSQ